MKTSIRRSFSGSARRETGFDVLDVGQAGLRGAADVALLQRAVAENRLVVTHDTDFSTLAVLQGEPVVGVVFLRPGHSDPAFTIGTLTSLLTIDPDVTQPFILVARRAGSQVTIRIRSVVP
jgi:hypothetical protein